MSDRFDVTESTVCMCVRCVSSAIKRTSNSLVGHTGERK